MVQFHLDSSPSRILRAAYSVVFAAFVFLCLAFFSANQNLNIEEITEEKIEAPISGECVQCLKLSFLVVENEKDPAPFTERLSREVYHMDIPTPPPEYVL